MSIQKIDVVHLIGGLSSAAGNLINVTNSGNASNALLAAITQLAKAISDSPATDTHLLIAKAEKSS